MQRYFFLFTLGWLASSCSSHQRIEPISMPVTFLEETLETIPSNLIDKENKTLPFNWWEIFEDSQLNRLIEEALTHSPSFHSSKMKISLARSLANQTRSALYPNLNLGADIARDKFSQTGIIPFTKNDPNSPFIPQGAGIPLAATGGKDRIPVYFTQYETEITLGYEFDFWGKNRNTLKAALGRMRAAVADHLFSRLQLSIAVAKTYFQLQIDLKRHVILKEWVEIRRSAAELIENRVNHHLDDNFSFKIANSDLLESLQQLMALELEIELRKNQLKAYVAKDFTETIDFLDISAQSLPRVPIPEELPLHLLSRRPDITSQIWLIESAGKEIEVAKAGFYPDFNLYTLYGYQTLHLPKLLSWPSSFFNIDPSVSLPIFDGGRLKANLSNTEIQYDLEILKYNGLVLQAVQETLDALKQLHNADQQLKVFERLTKDQEELFQLSVLRLKNHLNSKLDQLAREDNLYQAKEKEIMALGLRLDAILSLIKALGGGYEICTFEDQT